MPRKSVKSSDIREMTEESAKKKVTSKEKFAYAVGPLRAFADHLTQLHADGLADDIIVQLAKLFEEVHHK